MDKNHLIHEFAKYSAGTPVIISAPGRVNLIGEHTDYNHGFVLPAAIDKRMIIALGKNEDQHSVKLKALDFGEELELDIAKLPAKLSGWQGYILAILQELHARALNPNGFYCVFSSDIPIGAGMSSSAALCCGIISGLNVVFEWNLEKLAIARIAQASEHRLGVKVGLMDQFVVMYGKKNNAVLLDCLDYNHKYYPLDIKEYSLVLINTHVKHELVESAYNDRRASCERTLAVLQQNDENIKTLRDVTHADLLLGEGITDEDLRRVAYVLAENERVLKTVQALADNDFRQVGELLYQSHAGLSNEYEVSCPELDLLVDLARKESAILGARMMGGGFGGCTINLVKTTEAESVVSKIMIEYQKQTQIQAESYAVAIEDGIKFI
jgi:galactokinase